MIPTWTQDIFCRSRFSLSHGIKISIKILLLEKNLGGKVEKKHPSVIRPKKIFYRNRFLSKKKLTFLDMIFGYNFPKKFFQSAITTKKKFVNTKPKL